MQKRGSLDPPEVGTVRGADFDHIVFLDEKRNLHRHASGNRHGFKDITRSVSTQGVGGFDHCSLDRGGHLEPDRFVVHQKNVVGVSFDKEAIVLTDHRAVQYAVLVGFQIHEVMPVRILVTVLKLLRGGVHKLDMVSGTELGGGGGSAAQVAQSGLYEPGLPALSAVKHFNNEVRGALVDDDPAFTNVGG